MENFISGKCLILVIQLRFHVNIRDFFFENFQQKIFQPLQILAHVCNFVLVEEHYWESNNTRLLGHFIQVPQRNYKVNTFYIYHGHLDNLVYNQCSIIWVSSAKVNV